jgi:hypothetical protein
MSGLPDAAPFLFARPLLQQLYADDRNFYKVESGPGRHAHRIACYYAGNNLDKARKIFVAAVKHRPRIRFTIRQGIPVTNRIRALVIGMCS